MFMYWTVASLATSNGFDMIRKVHCVYFFGTFPEASLKDVNLV